LPLNACVVASLSALPDRPAIGSVVRVVRSPAVDRVSRVEAHAPPRDVDDELGELVVGQVRTGCPQPRRDVRHQPLELDLAPRYVRLAVPRWRYSLRSIGSEAAR